MSTPAASTSRIGALLSLVAVIALISAVLGTAGAAAAEPLWAIDSVSNTAVAPNGQLTYHIQIQNLGNADAKPDTNGDSVPDDPAVITIHLPPGVVGNQIKTPNVTEPSEAPICPSVVGQSTVICSYDEKIWVHHLPARLQIFALTVDVGADLGVMTAKFEVKGAGAAKSASTVDATLVTDSPTLFGIESLDLMATDDSGEQFTQAAGHPDALTTSIGFNTITNPSPLKGDAFPVSQARNVAVDLPAGLLGNPNAAGLDKCTSDDLSFAVFVTAEPRCSPASQVGTVQVRLNGLEEGANVLGPLPVYNMIPPPGSAARLGFNALGTVVVLDARVRNSSDLGVSILTPNISEGLGIASTSVTIWGDPGSSAHDGERSCAQSPPVFEFGTACASGGGTAPFLRMPTSCSGPVETTAHADSWAEAPGAKDRDGLPDLSDPTWVSMSSTSHEPPGFPANPEDPGTPWGPQQGTTGCDAVPVKGNLTASPTAQDVSTSTGLTVHVEVPNPGLENRDGIASSDIKGVKVALPDGITINPSQAEGLGVCSNARYESSELSFHPDGTKGCPSDSKIGSVSVKTPLLEESIPGDVYVAKPFDNPFGSLLALYVVFEEPQRGILIKLAGKVETDARTGQITTTFDNLPQQPFTSFDFKFREGSRAPLVTPPACGTYETQATFTPWSDPSHTLQSNSSFQIIHGIGGGPCPSGGLPPFKPGLIAGSLNNRAGAFSPFNIRLFRTDAEQEFTNFSIKLPPGISGKLAGVPFCSDAAIAASKAKTGAQEIASPSCPAASEVGHTLAGAGVGSVLTYAPGKIYLAGPYNGSALSIASVTAAKVGPFDLGTVVVRLALRVDPETAEVFVDATGSDPIPHIIDGITVHLRDIRAYVDKPEFTLNPTNCSRTSTASTLLGSGLDFSSAVDDRPVTVSTPYQAADCAALGFKPDLKLQLKGGTKRAGHPSLKATLKMKPGMANIARAQVTLPKSEFLDQSHIGTVCTRVQYAKDQCPPKSIYGYARAITPILDEPLQGPVYLRSSEHKLPDLVAALHSGKIEIDLAGRIDSVDGQIRSTFETVPDAPVSKFVLTMQGGKKGLLENSTNLCAKAHKAIVEFDGQNGKISDSNPIVKPQCSKAKRKKAARNKRAAH